VRRRHEFSAVIVPKLSRFGRSLAPLAAPPLDGWVFPCALRLLRLPLGLSGSYDPFTSALEPVHLTDANLRIKRLSPTSGVLLRSTCSPDRLPLPQVTNDSTSWVARSHPN
jgi:hypothetical protein